MFKSLILNYQAIILFLSLLFQMPMVWIFYVNSSLMFSVRHNLSITTRDFESLWIEIQSNLNHSIVCGVLYRHPHGDTQSFLNHVECTLDRVNNENKFCVLMGDFNLNLLNFESHTDTNEFLNILGTYLFSQHIIYSTYSYNISFRYSSWQHIFQLSYPSCH